MVDVSTEIVINRPIGEVSAYAADPDNAPEWYVNIKISEWETDPPLTVGSRIIFKAYFLGRELVYTYEVIEYVPSGKLTMRTQEGPFPMQTSYIWTEAGEDKTKMVLRNTGQPSGFSRLAAPFMARMMRKANEKDLINLKRILETNQ